MKFITQNFHTVPISPLLIPLIFFIIGIIWHTLFIIFITIFLLFVCLYVITNKKKYFLFHQLIIYSFFIALGSYLHQKNIKDYNDFYTLTNNKKVTFSGMIIDKNNINYNYKTLSVISLAIDTIATETTVQKSNKIILFYTKSNNNILVGDTVTFSNIVCKKPANESFQKYQIKEQILATIFAENLTYVVNKHPSWSLRYWIWNKKKRIVDKLENKLSSHGFHFFTSLFLGNRLCIKFDSEKTNEQFKTWGIYHFLARSGLHLALFVYMWQIVFCIIPLPIIIKQILISLISCIYFILTWTSTPFTRSFALFILNKICFINKIPFNSVHYLLVICFGFLLYCPLYLFFLDFQLTFALTFALVWLSQLSRHHESK